MCQAQSQAVKSALVSGLKLQFPVFSPLILLKLRFSVWSRTGRRVKGRKKRIRRERETERERERDRERERGGEEKGGRRGTSQ